MIFKSSLSINILSRLIEQFFLLVSGILLPIFIFQFYGSSMFGLISSLSSFTGLIVIIQSTLLIYQSGRIFNGNKAPISNIILLLKKETFLFSIIILFYFLIVFIFFLINQSFLVDFYPLTLVILLIFKFNDFLLISPYRSYFYGINKYYIIAFVSSLFLIIEILMYLLLSNFIYFFGVKIILILIQLFFYKIYHFFYKKNEESFFLSQDKKYVKDIQLEKSIRYSFILTLSTYFINNLLVMILTFFKDTHLIADYSILIFVINGAFSIFSTFTNSFIPYFGVQKDNSSITFQSFNNYFNILYNSFYISLIISMTPFINLYGELLSRVIDQSFIFILLLNFYFAGLRAPIGVKVHSNGDFKVESYTSLIHFFILACISFFIYPMYGIFSYILLSTILNILRYITSIIFNIKINKKTFVISSIIFSSLFLILFNLRFTFLNFNPSNFLIWFIFSTFSFFLSLLLFFLLNNLLKFLMKQTY
jgi:hypothetical protein